MSRKHFDFLWYKIVPKTFHEYHNLQAAFHIPTSPEKYKQTTEFVRHYASSAWCYSLQWILIRCISR